MHTSNRAPKHVVLSNLGPTETFLSVEAYDESTDTFRIELHNASPCAGLVDHQLPAVLLPYLVGEYGEPDEFVNTRWIITQPGF